MWGKNQLFQVVHRKKRFLCAETAEVHFPTLNTCSFCKEIKDLKGSLRAGIKIIPWLELTQVIPHIPDFEANFFPHVPVPGRSSKRKRWQRPSIEMIPGMLLERWMAKPQMAMAHSARGLQSPEGRISWEFRFPESCSPAASCNSTPAWLDLGVFP